MSKILIRDGYHALTIIAIGIAVIMLLLLTPPAQYAAALETMPYQGDCTDGPGEAVMVPPSDSGNHSVTSGIAISIERDNVDYGNVMPGESSLEEIVVIANSGPQDVNITLEIEAEALARDFYEKSLYIDGGVYNPEQALCVVNSGDEEEVITQLRVPQDWAGLGMMQATFIFWAEAVQ
ncbi:MAG: hypothetical protein PHI12_09615 [Dehalococcoidales bacterium]|nr:hypothetical protein [Dehalococcoidales bacterium]